MILELFNSTTKVFLAWKLIGLCTILCFFTLVLYYYKLLILMFNNIITASSLRGDIAPKYCFLSIYWSNVKVKRGGGEKRKRKFLKSSRKDKEKKKKRKTLQNLCHYILNVHRKWNSTGDFTMKFLEPKKKKKKRKLKSHQQNEIQT